MKRVHRTFWERFYYLAIYECRDCHEEKGVLRRYRFHFGAFCRCPKCGTHRLKKLKERDGIDPMFTGILNYVERLAGGSLYHCCFCRLQFYDRRVLNVAAPENPAEPNDHVASEGIMTPPNKASSGA